MTAPFQYSIRGRNIVHTGDKDAAARMWDMRDVELEDWIKSIWQADYAIADGAIGRSKLSVDAIQSTNYAYTSGDFSDAGSFFDLANGNIRTPGLWVNGATGDVSVLGAITATSLALVDSGTTYITFSQVNEFTVTGYGFKYDDPDWTNAASDCTLQFHGSNTAGDDQSGLRMTANGEDWVSSMNVVAEPGYVFFGGAVYNAAGTLDTRMQCLWIDGVGAAARFYTGYDAGSGYVGALIEATTSPAGATAIDLDATTITIGDANATIGLANDTILVSNKSLRDSGGRRFYRSDNGRTEPQLIQYGSTTATADSNSRITATFPESFSAAPTVVATRVSTSTNQLVAQVYSVSATTVTFTVTSNDATQAGVSGITVNWAAFGYKNL